MPFNYSSRTWIELSQKMRRRQYRCEICQRTARELKPAGGYLVTHHRLDVDRFTAQVFEADFLLVCCIECHEAIHSRPYSVQTPIMVQWELFGPSAQLVDDMGIGEKREHRRSQRRIKAECRTYEDEHRRVKAIGDRRDIDAQKKHDLAIGVLEEYDRLRSLFRGDDDGNSTTETARPTGPRSP